MTSFSSMLEILTPFQKYRCTLTILNNQFWSQAREQPKIPHKMPVWQDVLPNTFVQPQGEWINQVIAVSDLRPGPYTPGALHSAEPWSIWSAVTSARLLSPRETWSSCSGLYNSSVCPKSYKYGEGTGASLLWGKAKGAEHVQPWEETTELSGDNQYTG